MRTNRGKLVITAMLAVAWTSGLGLAASYEKGPWTFQVDPDKQSFSITHRTLGTVMDGIRLETRQDNRQVQAGGFAVDASRPDALAITSKTPSAATWKFQVTDDRIQVESSAPEALVGGIAPAGVQRIPARIAERDKMESRITPGNASYTGEPAEERAYKPATAGNVMYLALGFVDAGNLHALFDRPTDTVIRFADQSRMTRNAKNPQQMDVRIPLRGAATLVSLVPDYFVKVLGMPKYVPLDDRIHKTAPVGWNHWLAFFREVTEKDIVEHADWIAANLKAYGMEHVQLDDGFDHEEHRHWNKDWDPKTFPHGPEWLAHYIKAKGFVPGLWTVPYCYCVQHGKPGWFLRDENGKVVMDYQGGGELDFSKPEVIRDYWIPMMQTLKKQGWEYYKFDMGSTVPRWAKYKDRFYDKTRTPYDLSVATMKAFREVMGPEIWHTNHPDNWGGRMGFVDVVGCGKDPGPGWKQLNNFLEVISNNTYQNHLIWYSDPDCIVLRGKATRADAAQHNTEFASLEEARTAASLLSITGLQFLSGDDLLNLEKDRVELIKKTIPILPIFPIDIFGRGRDRANYPQIFDLKVNMASGKYDVIAVANWSAAPAKRTVSFPAELALSGSKEYLVFDFWQERLIGAFCGSFQTDLPAHGTRVFQIHPRLDRPQLVGNNRHITGAAGIRKQNWDAPSMTLRGTSETVAGAPYSLFVHVPAGMKVGKVNANAAGVAHKLQPDGLLALTLLGQAAPVDWSITFIK